ncbi:DUF397 domain-containing protein [Sphaerisporangium viridialbum]|uniref:DUF397 domain-containing protein n=1 Tax=Sphaerisporangium viridialbum TaxID=46189 RepID=UPI003C713663
MDRPDLSRPSWRRSTYSGQTGNCVEVTGLPGGRRAMRDSKNPNGPILTSTHAEWRAFIRGVKADELR